MKGRNSHTVDRNTEQRWSRPDPNSSGSSLGVGEGKENSRREFLGSVGALGTVGVLDRLAGTAWSDRLTSAVQSPLSEVWSTNNPETVVDYFIEDGLVYVATGLSVRTLDVDTGQEVSRVVLDERIRPHGLAKDGKWLAVALENNRLQILDVNSFSTQVTIPYTGEARGIAANNGAVYVGRTEGLASRNLPDGDVRWRHDFSVNSPVWQTSEGIWVNKRGKDVMLSEADGKVLWKNGFGGGKYFEGDWLRDGDHFWGFVATESHIVTGSPGGGYHVADKFTGEIAWSQGGSGHVNRPAVSSDRVVHQYDTELHFREFDTGEKVVPVPFRPNAKGITFHGGLLLGFGTWNNEDTHVATGLDPSSGGIRWKEETDGPIGLLTTRGPRVYGVNLKTNEIVKYRLEGSSSGGSTGGTGSSDDSQSNRNRNSSDSGRASFNLSGKQTSVAVGEMATITLSAVNYVTSKPMTVQLLLETPSGVQVASVEGADAGSNQFTAVTTVKKGGEANINIKLRVNERGEYTVVGKAVYYFDDKDNDGGVHTEAVTLTAGKNAGTTVSAKEKDSDDGFGTAMLRGGNDVLQWVGANPIVSLLVVAVGGLVGGGLVRRRRGADESVAGTDGEQTHGKRNPFRAVTRTAHRGPNVRDGLGGLQTIIDTAIVKPLNWSYRKADWGGFALGTLGVFFAGQLVLAVILGLLLQPLLLALNGVPAGNLVGTGVEFVVTLGIWGMLLYGIVRAISMVTDLEPQATGSGSRGRQRPPTAQGASDNPEHELAGEWKHETVEAEQAHRDAQQRDQQPVDVGEKVAFPIREVTHEEGQVRGEVETFQIFVDQDVPSDLQVGDTICVQIMNYATNEDGNRIGAHARFLNHGAC